MPKWSADFKTHPANMLFLLRLKQKKSKNDIMKMALMKNRLIWRPTNSGIHEGNPSQSRWHDRKLNAEEDLSNEYTKLVYFKNFIFRISVKSLLDYACLYTQVDDDCEEFINFCAVFEQVVSHRLRRKSRLSQGEKWKASVGFALFNLNCCFVFFIALVRVTNLPGVQTSEGHGVDLWGAQILSQIS